MARPTTRPDAATWSYLLHTDVVPVHTNVVRTYVDDNNINIKDSDIADVRIGRAHREKYVRRRDSENQN
jgi:hypothetical protein